MKIQINSLDALERLIGGDSEVEIEIRNSIVQEFTKKYLKSVAEKVLDSEVAVFTKGIKATFQQQAQDAIGEMKNPGFYSQTFTPTENFKRVIKEEANKAVSKEITSVIDARITEMVKQGIEEQIDYNRVKMLVAERFGRGIESKLKDAMTAKLASFIVDSKFDISIK